MISLLQTAERTTDYSMVNNYIFQRHLFAYHAVAPLINGNTIELGCGQGYGANLLFPFASSYTAVDKNRPGKSLHTNINFHQARLPRLSNIASSTYDTVVCFQVIEHIKRDEFFLMEIERILRPGGQLFITTPNALTTLSRNPFHIREYRAKELEGIVCSVFRRWNIQGLYGNQRVLSYYLRNKKMVDAICRFDLFDLQNSLPSWMLRVPYTVLNNLSRVLLYKKGSETINEFCCSDFYLDDLSEECLDLFVCAVK